MVLKVGLEPTRHSTPVPKTGVAAITPLEHMVLEVGLEPTRPISANGFLELNVSAALTLTTGYPASPLRLPIPPFEHM